MATATLVIDRQTLPEQLASLFMAPRIAVMPPRKSGEVLLAPVIDPADYDNDTDYLNAIPGMTEKLIEGMNTPLSECEDIPAEWRNV